MTVRQVLSAFRIRFDPEENKNLTEERGFFMKNLIVGQSGGPTAVINSSLYGVIQEGLAHSEEIGHVYGMINGIQGFLKGKYMDLAELDSQTLTALRTTPGAYLGSCRYKLPENLSDPVYAELFWKFEELSIGYFLYIGGNDSMDTVSKLSRAAEIHKSSIRFIGVPKTIDNDLPGTERTFGFDTAMAMATEALDRLHTTAESHHRVMVLEVMGRYAGWIALHSGLAGGADVILIPEIPYRIESVIEKVKARQAQGKQFSIIVVAEGSKPVGGKMTVARLVKNSFEQVRLGGVGNKLADEIEAKTGIEARCTILGYLQRGGSPTAFDRVLSTRYGSAAVEACLAGAYNVMVALSSGEIVRIPIEEVAGKPHQVPLDSDLIRAGRNLGISFGD